MAKFQAPASPRADDSFLGSLRLYLGRGPPPAKAVPRGLSAVGASYARGGHGVNLAYSFASTLSDRLFRALLSPLAPATASGRRALQAGVLAAQACATHAISRARTRFLVDGHLEPIGIWRNIVAACENGAFARSLPAHIAHVLALFTAMSLVRPLALAIVQEIRAQRELNHAKRWGSARDSAPAKKERDLAVFEARFREQLASAAVTAIGTLLVMPLQVVRTRLEYQDAAEFAEGLLDCVRKIFENEGVAGFYRGVTTFLLSLGPQAVWMLSIYLIGKGLIELEESHHDDDEE